jgi:hypothetical protein
VRNDLVEVRRAQIDRVHSTAKEVTDNSLFAGIAITERLADGAARAIGAYQVGGLDRVHHAIMDALNVCCHAEFVLRKADQTPAIVDRDARKGSCMTPEHLLHEFLRDAVRKFSRAPRA